MCKWKIDYKNGQSFENKKKREQTSSTFKAYFKVYEQHKSHCAPIEQNIKTKLKILYKKFNENKF